MPQIMAETFARGLLDKIMIEVLDVIDRKAQNGKEVQAHIGTFRKCNSALNSVTRTQVMRELLLGKSWGHHDEETVGDGRSEFTHESQVHERIRANYSKIEEMELITKIVNGLRNIQIGDSHYVLPPSLLALEKQVKCAACTVDGTTTSLTNSATDVTEAQRTTQGQGDMHQIVHAAVLESPTEPSELSTKLIRKEKEAEAREATNVSVGLLHQLIEELENKAIPAGSKDDTSLDSTSKERFFVWEEKEEQFVRTIEGNVSDDTYEIGTKTLRESESAANRFHVVRVNYDEELESRSSQHVTGVPSSSGEADLTEIHIEKRESNPISTLPRDAAAAAMEQSLNAKKRKASGDASRTKKKGLGNRLRRLLRIAFGRSREN